MHCLNINEEDTTTQSRIHKDRVFYFIPVILLVIVLFSLHRYWAKLHSHVSPTQTESNNIIESSVFFLQIDIQQQVFVIPVLINTQ